MEKEKISMIKINHGKEEIYKIHNQVVNIHFGSMYYYNCGWCVLHTKRPSGSNFEEYV